MRSSSLLEFRCIVLNPSPDRRMVDLQTTLDQQFSDLAIRQGVSKIPADGTENDLWCEVSPLEDRRPLRRRHDLSSIAACLRQRFCNTSWRSDKSNSRDNRRTASGSAI